MNIAEDIRSALTGEGNRPARACFIEPKIKPLAFEKREDVMEKRVGIRKLNATADRNYL
jgi:hypothetical protein